MLGTRKTNPTWSGYNNFRGSFWPPFTFILLLSARLLKMILLPLLVFNILSLWYAERCDEDARESYFPPRLGYQACVRDCLWKVRGHWGLARSRYDIQEEITLLVERPLFIRYTLYVGCMLPKLFFTSSLTKKKTDSFWKSIQFLDTFPMFLDVKIFMKLTSISVWWMNFRDLNLTLLVLIFREKKSLIASIFRKISPSLPSCKATSLWFPLRSWFSIPLGSQNSHTMSNQFCLYLALLCCNNFLPHGLHTCGRFSPSVSIGKFT